jgi:hypothetical protein
MAIHDLAATAACNTGNVVQQFRCGWSHPTAPKHPSLAYSFGHGVLPLLVIIIFVALLVVSATRKRNRQAAPPAPSGRKALARR